MPTPDVYNYNRPTELSSSRGFGLEYAPVVVDREIRDDIVSYLGEYRFALPKYDYDLVLSRQENSWRLADPHRQEAMTTKAYRAIAEKRMRGETSHREEAELVGLTFLEQQLKAAQVGDSIIWFSPPGPTSEGYAKYGFVFEGSVVAEMADQKIIKMTANRLENPTLEQFNMAFKAIVGADFNATSADDFLRMPIVIKGGVSREFTDLVLANTFGFADDPRKKERFQLAITKVSHLIEDFVRNGRYLPIPERRKKFHAIENIMVEMRNRGDNEIILFETPITPEEAERYSYEPEQVRGSCPKKSSNFLSNGVETVNDLIDGENCPSCKLPKGDNHYHCPECEKRYDDETNIDANSRTKECGCGFKFNCN